MNNKFFLLESTLSNIDFPKNELKSLRQRLNQNKSIYTTRILNEYNKYKLNEIYFSPLGKLKVVNIQKGEGIDSHPFKDELTESQKKQINGHKYDLIELRRI